MNDGKSSARQAHWSYDFGLIAKGQGRSRSAMAYFRSEIRQSSFARAHLSLAHLLLARGRRQEARLHYRQAFARGETQATRALALNGLGLVSRAEGRTQEALTHYRAAARLDRTDATALLNGATALLADGDYAEGRAWLERASRRSKDDSEAEAWIGHALVEYDVDVRRGVRLLERVTHRDPMMAEAWADLAMGYLKLNAQSKARAAAEQARAQLPAEEGLRAQILEQLRKVSASRGVRIGRSSAKAK